jgi:putative FmdB family regulatory protein
MPTYEYACTKCGQEFEFYQSMLDKPLTTCPKEKCGKKTWGKGKVKKLMSAGAGLLFKGTGFYITDYRSENYKQSAKNEASAGKGGDKKTSGDTKSPGGESKSGGETKAAPAKSEAKSAAPAPKAK